MAVSTSTGYYERLGVRRVVNGWGSSTILGGSTPAPGVVAAMEEANGAYVEMGELLQRSGDFIADILGCEAAYITSGAAAALALCTAASMAGTDPDKIAQLPDTTGLRNEVVIPKGQRYRYDRCFTIAGAKLVNAGDDKGCTAEQLAAAIGPQTAAVAYVIQGKTADGMVSIEDAVEVAHQRGLPVIADAAGQIYPLDDFRENAQSADLVCFCAKYFDAPQSAGFVCGTKEMIDVVSAHGFAAFHTAGAGVVEAMVPDGRAWGRTMKVDRQEVVGVLAALEDWFSMDHEERLSRYESKFAAITDKLAGIPGVASEVVDTVRYWRRELHVAIDTARFGRTAKQIAEELDQGNPRVWVAFFGDDRIVIKVNALNEGDEHILGQRLREALVG